MSEELRKVRKGTKSCTECRRRKVRCTWSTDEAPKCRRCEERGSNCVAQIYSLRSSASKKLSSRDRIARLEHQLSTLSKALRNGNQGGDQPIPPPEPRDAVPVDDSDSEDSLYGSSDSEGAFGQDPPQHLQTLFENDLLSLDHSKKDAHELHRTKALAELSATVRRRLQELIPPKEDVDVIAGFASRWLSVFHALFPAPTMIKSGEEMIQAYEEVKTATISPAFLATWLLSIAMTMHQVPKGQLGPEHQMKGFRNPMAFTKSVSDAVEDTIMQHDALLGTIQGIDSAMLFLRLQLSRGNFKKVWLMMRRVIAVAELIGLHRAARRADAPTLNPVQEGFVWHQDIEQSNARKAQVWESLCSVDRIAGMMFNLPAGTRRYRLPQNVHILQNGELSRRAYLCSLSEIAMKVQDLDDLEILENGDAELYATVLKIDNELRLLASVTPASWWHKPDHVSDHLLQYWHYYITVRVHLPFTLRHDTSEQFSFSRLACMKACQAMASRYQSVRTALPGGFFLLRIVDLQTFTALVVLILAYYAASPLERSNLLAQGSRSPELLIPEVLTFMKSIVNEPASEFANQAATAVSSLTQLLSGDDSNQPAGDLKIKVPLLGKLQIRRKKKHQLFSRPPTTDPAVASMSALTMAQTDSSGLTLTNDSSPFGASSSGMDSNTDEYPWDPLSWSLQDDQAGIFQDTLMVDDFTSTTYGTWWDPNSGQFGQ